MKYICSILLIMFSAAAHAQDDRTQACSPEPVEEAMAGGDLSTAEVAALEQAVAKHPDDLSARTRLLGYYFTRQFSSRRVAEARRKHILWIIANRPEARIAGEPYCELDANIDRSGYAHAKNLWLNQTKSHAQDTRILGHAAWFFLRSDEALAESLLKQAQQLEPGNPHWPDQLGLLYGLRHEGNAAGKALAEYEQAQAVDRSEYSRYVRLDKLAKSAFDAGETEKAARYASELLNASGAHPKDWNYGNAIHHGNTVLGRIALKQGDIRQAGEFLLKAGATPGSPQLNSFGPSMTLARELLEKGETETVLQYFELCRKFWKMGGAQLDNWTRGVKAGQTPDFEANLRY